jgi:hypothetical protein
MHRLLTLVATAILSGALAAASVGPAHAADRPWAEGVPKEKQDAALARFTEGTGLLKEAYFKRAVDVLREALILWDHPAIHFNLAKALINLDQPVEAHFHFEQSMRYGGAPLDSSQVAQVAALKAQLFDTELAELSVTLSEPADSLRVNGAEVARKAKSWKGIIRAGKVVVLATKDGFQPSQTTETAAAGSRPALNLTLTKIDLNIRYTREMAVWKPWTVLGAGVLGVGVGYLFNTLSVDAYGAYDRSVANCASANPATIPDLAEGEQNDLFRACPANDPSIKTAKLNEGDTLRAVSIASYAAGGATLVTGLVLLYINREKVVDGAGTTGPVTLAPTLAPGSAGLSATVQF